MRALPPPTRITVVDEHAIQPRCHHVMHRVMQNAVPDVRRRDDPDFGIQHREQAILAVPIPPPHQLLVKLEHLTLQVELERRPFTAEAPPLL